MHAKSALFALVFVLLPISSAHAWRIGEDVQIRFIQDVGVKGHQGETLFLGHLVKTQFFGAGIYVTDGGYVLGIKGDNDKFYHMPTGDELVRLQQAGLLPDPLPPYRLNILDYLFGYSLWIVLAVVAAWQAIKALRPKKPVAQP